MYVNKGDDKIKQLHADIGRTIPKEDLKLGQKMEHGDVVKKKKKKNKSFKKIQKDADQIDRIIQEAPIKLEESKQPKVPSKKELLQIILDFEKKEKEKKKKNKNKVESFNKRVRRDRLYNVAKEGGKIKKKKYSYRRGGMTTLRKPKRG